MNTLDSIDEKAIYLTIAPDRNYGIFACVAIQTVILHLPSEYNLYCYIIDCGLNWIQKKKIKKLFSNKHKHKYKFIEFNVEEVKELPKFAHVTRSAYARLFLTELLPQHISKILYIDCDTITINSISSLWEIDLEDKYIAAYASEESIVSNPNALSIWHELGFQKNDPYFNSGILLMNISKMREDNIIYKIRNFNNKYRHTIKQIDQTVLNAVLGKNVMLIDRKWNYEIRYWNANHLDNELEFTIESLRKHAVILHFLSCNKPWMHKIKHSCRDIYFYYVDISPWSGWRPVPDLAYIKKRCFINAKNTLVIVLKNVKCYFYNI